MGEWDQMAEYVSKLDDGDENKQRISNTAASGDGSSNGSFFRAVLSVRRGKVFIFLYNLYNSFNLILCELLYIF